MGNVAHAGRRSRTGRYGQSSLRISRVPYRPGQTSSGGCSGNILLGDSGHFAQWRDGRRHGRDAGKGGAVARRVIGGPRTADRAVAKSPLTFRALRIKVPGPSTKPTQAGPKANKNER